MFVYSLRIIHCRSQGEDLGLFLYRTHMNFPKLGHLFRKLLFSLFAHPLPILLMRNRLTQHPLFLTTIHKVEEIQRDSDILPQPVLDVDRRARRPAQKQRLDQGRVRDAGVRRPQAGEEPAGAGAVEGVADEVAHRVEVGAVEEDGVRLGPRVAVDDEDGDVDVGVERAAFFARVEDDAGGGGVGLGVAGGGFEGL